MPTTTAPVVIGETLGGDVAYADGIVYLLTDCCKASGKGGEHGVICRACHQPVPAIFGWAALVFATNVDVVDELGEALHSLWGGDGSAESRATTRHAAELMIAKVVAL